MNRHTEQEWQFSAHELAPTRAWMAAQPHEQSQRRLALKSTLQLQDTYYDSSDWMIFRAGFALRMRRAREDDATGDGDAEVTLKSLHTSNGGLARRIELSEHVASASIDDVLARHDGIGERIRELVGTRQLSPLFHARTRRERQQLLEAESELPLAEVDLDETSIETPSGATQQLKRVEVECINAEPAALTLWVEQLRDAAHLRPVEVSKFRAGLIAAGLDPSAPPELGSLEISPSQPFAATQLAMFRRYFAVVLASEPMVRAGSVHAVHEMRVALRHLEVLLRLFRGLAPAWAVNARDGLRALVKALGAVRDCDVQLAFVDASRAALGDAERASMVPLRESLEGERSANRARLLRTLDSPRTRAWAQSWLEQLRGNAPEGTPASEVATAQIARDLIREQARRLRKYADRLKDKSAPEAYHDVRIRTKRLRYTLDAFEGLYGEVAREYARALARLQNVLGEYHDATVREQHFTELVAGGPRLPAATSFLIGRLVERDVNSFEQCRRKFPKAYRRIWRRRWRELRDAMDTQVQATSAATAAAATDH
jgi:CHAD domain-containing protein